MRSILSLLFLLLVASVGFACNVPVFRYALERWQPDSCKLTVFYRGSLSASDAAIVDELIGQTSGSGGWANATVVRVDLSKADGSQQQLWNSLPVDAANQLPYVVTCATLVAGKDATVWHGPLETTKEVGILKSPARDELARRLLAGDCVVWLMIGSSDESRNAAVRKMLLGNFDPLARRIKLPEGIGMPGSELFSEVPLVVRFSLLEIDRADPLETFLVQLLSGLRPAAFGDGQPLIVPVFGRGRALEVVPADDFSLRLMENLALFLNGACSCQVKERNPGFDLLLSVDWNTELFGESEPPPAAKSSQERSKPVLLSIPPSHR